ncbi:hypothetical protein E2C01_028295 [Portunus trituberculatus]|uniref:Uncharacterized protein n=1 Tax=Portunus trituberculatus TaxID=210409 RepID=A0A5B7EKZ8_PORTR|nr:hypothetical protein [Portunus trituberculatus]
MGPTEPLPYRTDSSRQPGHILTSLVAPLMPTFPPPPVLLSNLSALQNRLSSLTFGQSIFVKVLCVNHRVSRSTLQPIARPSRLGHYRTGCIPPDGHN